MSHINTQTSTLHSCLQNSQLYVKNGKLYLKTSLPSDKKAIENSEDNEAYFKDTTKQLPQRFLEKIATSNYGYLLLRESDQVFEKIYAEQDMERQIQYFSLYALLFSAIYGFLLGMYSGNFQMIAGAVKFPLLVFGTLFLCLPPLYMVNILIGVKLSFRQTLVILLGVTYVMSALLASLSPILVFAMLNTTSNNVICIITLISCSISGIFALNCVWKGMTYLINRQGAQSNTWIIKIWSVMFMLVGTQLSWGLRPFIGQRGEFILFRLVEGNFYLAVFTLLKECILSIF